MKKQFLLRFFTGTPLIACLAFIAAGSAAAAETLVPRGSVWKYLDNGSDQGTAWREPAFNDSTWASGPAQLGYGDGDEVTIVRFGTNAVSKYITTYFRKSFDTPSANYSNLTINLLRDDGAVVYLNGVEVFRSNMPDGPVSSSTLATLAVGGAEETTQFISAPISPSALASGRNVLAVEVHQNTPTSSDLSFDLELVADGAGTQLPVVTLQVVDGEAAEVPPNSDQPTNPAVFRITRSGPTDGALSIGYTLGGNASNGVDYVALPGAVEIPAGAVSVDVQVDVIDDTLVEGLETVVLTLVSPVCVAIVPPPPGCYRLGLPNSASAVIRDSSVVGNSPPTVALTSPRDGAVIWGPTNIWLMAMANDADGYLTLKSVEFFEGTRSLGIRTNYPTLTPGNPFILQWSNVPLGDYTLTAIATDDHAARATSAPVHISVITTPAEVTFVSALAVWRYMDRGINLSNAWTSVLFNDTDWPTGPAQLGYGDGDEATMVGFGPDPSSKYITTYFRKKFEVFDAAGYAQLRARLREDDGAVVYVNSVEVFRSNLPPGPVTFNTLATTAVEDQILEFTAPPSALREGLNVVAVEMHQVNPASSDLSFDLELIGERGTRPPELPIVNVVATVTNTVESSPLALVAPGVFTFSRTGPVTNGLTVFFALSGSAQNGIDYIRITNAVRFAPGQSEVRVNVNALPDNLAEGTETVVVTLESPACALVMPPPPDCYRVGASSQATVFIKDGPTGNEPPFVQLNSPQNGEVFTAPAQIELRAYAQDPEDRYELRVEFFAGDQNLGQGTFVPALCPAPFCPYYALTWSNVPPGPYTLRAKATDSAGASSFSQPVSIRVEPVNPGTNVLIANGSVWKYLDNGSDQGTAWREGSFNDSTWAAGPAQLGYGDGDESTIVAFGPDPANKYITTYFRRSFNVTNAALVSSQLQGRLLEDDGAVVYLNGVEIFRSNLPTGPIAYDTFAIAVLPDNQIVEFSAPAGSLVNGVNVVAVEMHQVNPVSSDISFDLQLTATGGGTGNQPPQVRITTPLNGAVFDSPTNIAIEAVTTDLDGYAGTVEFFANDVKIGEASVVFIQAPPPGQPIHFDFTWLNPPAGQYRLTARTVDDRGATGVSEPVNITVQGPSTGERELHLVGIYSGTGPDGGTSRNNERGRTAVAVNRPGKRVTLFLSAYEPVDWYITASTGTIIDKVYLSGYYPPNALGLAADVEVVTLPYGYYIGYTLESGQFYRLAPKIRALTGMEIASFHGNYQGPYPAPFVIDMVQDDPRLRSDYPVPTPLSQLPDLHFDISFYSGAGIQTRAYTLAGPSAGGSLLEGNDRAVPDGSGRYYYALSGDGVVQIDAVNNTVRRLPMPADVPELSWPMGLTYDSQRDRVLLVSLGGEGFLYSYSPALDRWSVVSSMNNLDLASLTYHPHEDALYGMGVSQPDDPYMTLYRLNPDGTGATQRRLPLYPWGVHMHSSELVSVGEYLVLLLRPTYFGAQGTEYEESRMYVIKPSTGEVWLTLRESRSQPPNQPPIVSITSPTSGALFLVGSSVQITATAVDYDNYATKVEFFANGQKIGERATDPNSLSTTFTFTWPNVQLGNYSLTAKATDTRGGVGISAPVNIGVVTELPNQPPLVQIFSPTNRSIFNGPTNIFIRARASDPDGRVVRVTFFEGTNFLGYASQSGTNQIFTLVWSNVAPRGVYLLSAQAIDDRGATTLSERVMIAVISYLTPPLVQLSVIDPSAAEAGSNPATFRITRTPARDVPLTVHYGIGGTAANGTDYAPLAPPGEYRSEVVIPAGSNSVDITIHPIDDALVEGTETVELGLRQTPWGTIPTWPPAPDGYFIDLTAPPSRAFIADNDTRPVCACDGPTHADYVNCVIRRSWELFRSGLITEDERRTAIREAIMSNCGSDPLRSEPVCIHLLPLTPDECRLGGIQFVLSGDAAGACVLECSTDLINWAPVTTDPVAIDGAEITCPMDDAVKARFYRVRAE